MFRLEMRLGWSIITNIRMVQKNCKNQGKCCQKQNVSNSLHSTRKADCWYDILFCESWQLLKYLQLSRNNSSEHWNETAIITSLMTTELMYVWVDWWRAWPQWAGEIPSWPDTQGRNVSRPNQSRTDPWTWLRRGETTRNMKLNCQVECNVVTWTTEEIVRNIFRYFIFVWVLSCENNFLLDLLLVKKDTSRTSLT